jgi:FMN reductase
MDSTVVVGHPQHGSRTSALAELAATQMITALGHEPPWVLETSCLAGELVAGGPQLDDAVERLLTSRLIFTATPAFKGTYTGVLKVLLDSLGHRALEGTIAVSIVTANSPAHLVSTQTHLRDVMTELGADSPVPGLTLCMADWAVHGENVQAWVSAHAATLGRCVDARRLAESPAEAVLAVTGDEPARRMAADRPDGRDPR